MVIIQCMYRKSGGHPSNEGISVGKVFDTGKVAEYSHKIGTSLANSRVVR